MIKLWHHRSPLHQNSTANASPSAFSRLAIPLGILAMLLGWPGEASAELVLTDPGDPLYYEVAIAAGDEIDFEKGNVVHGDLHSNGTIRMKKDVTVFGDVSAVGNITSLGTVDGTVTVGAEPVTLPPIPTEAELRALADRVFEQDTTFTNATIDDVVFVAGKIEIVGSLSGTGTLIALDDVRLRTDTTPLQAGTRHSILSLGSIRIDQRRTFRGVLRAAGDVDLQKDLSIEAVVIADGRVDVKKNSQVAALVLDDEPPVLEVVRPLDGSTVDSTNPEIVVTWSDAGSGLDLASAELLVDGIDRTAEATIDAAGLTYTPIEPLAVGSHTFEVAIRDLVGLEGRIASSFTVPSQGSPPTLILISPREAVVFESPQILVSYSDPDPGLDLSSLAVEVDGVSVLADCQADANQATCGPEIGVGPHMLRVTIADLDGTETTIESEFERIAENQPPVLTVDEPADGILTNETLLTVRGTVVDDGVVTSVTLGDQELAVAGTTFEGLATVSDGPNTLVVEATDAAGNVASVSRSFTVDLESPEVVLISPQSSSITHQDAVRIQGFVSDLNGITDASLLGQPLTLDDGAFDTVASLSEGDNLIDLSFTDGAGNIQGLLLEVEYRPLPEIAITEPADLSATAATTVTVRGTVGPGIGSVAVAGIPATLAGTTFEAEVPLREGRNAITAVASATGGGVGMATVAVLHDATPPRLTLESPDEGQEVDTAELTVRGMVADPVSGFDPPGALSVTIGGLPTEIAQGGYRGEVTLVPGANTLTIVATDALGNSSQLTRQVVYTPRAGQRLEIVSGNRQQVEVLTAAPDPLTVRAVDTAGQPVVGQLVVFTAEGNDGLLAPDLATPGARKIAVTSDAQGLASAFFTTGTFAGVASQRVTAAAVGFGDPKIFELDALPSPPDRLVVDSGNGQVGLVGSTLSRELVAVAVDASGNRLADVAVVFTVREGGGQLDNGSATKTVTTDGRGRAVARWALGGETGISNHVVRASFVDFPELGFASFVASAESAGDPADTRIVGVVLDNTDQPVPGATVSLAGTGFQTTTGPDGRFALLGLPVGDALLDIDADTTDRPGRWPHLEFEMFLLPGVENRLDRPIYVLPLDDSEGVTVSETEGGTLTLAAVPGFALDIAPGSVTFPDGSRSGTVSVTPVHTDRVPMEPNFGQQPRFVVTIQPAGAKFDPPARLTLPNVSGLAPGRTTEMFSFDHDLGRFVAIGHGTVSVDGTVIASNPGVGVLEAGWHCGADPEDGAGSTHKCNPCEECEGDTCVANPDVNGFPICDDKDRCTINDRCEDGYCRGTFVRIYDIEGPCIAALGQPVTFVARSNGGSLLKWRGGGSPPEGMGGTFTTVFGEDFIPEDQFSGSATVTASCALSKSKTINLGRSCAGVTPELIQELEEIPDTPTLKSKNKQGQETEGQPWGLHETEYDLDVTGCLSGGEWCFRLKSLTAMHKIYVQETVPPDRTPLTSPDDGAINGSNCDRVIADLTPQGQYACPGSGGEPRAPYFEFVPVPVVRVHEEAHRQDTIDCIDEPLFNHMKAFIADGKRCEKCAPTGPPSGLFESELEDQELILTFNKAYGLDATNLPDLFDMIDQLGDKPNRADEGRAYQQENAELERWISRIRQRARDNGWKEECR